jgi:hypothetical protein
MVEVDNLIVPVYLNQRIVFDMIAMLQGGIATVTNITMIDQNKDDVNAKAGVSFGLSEALSSLLKIRLSGDVSGSSEESAEKKVDEERIHTPASLFYTLRNLLYEKNLLKVDEEKFKPNPGDIVEFETTLKRNPIIETMDSFVELIDLVTVFSEEPQKSVKGKKKSGTSENQKIKNQISSFSESLKSGNSIDLTTGELKCKYKTVVTIEIQYLNDPLMSDLVDGTFHVVGKIIRVVPDEGDAINLMRKTAMSKMPTSALSEAFGGLSALTADQGFDLPDLTWEIKGPVIQIIPIAIFS